VSAFKLASDLCYSFHEKPSIGAIFSLEFGVTKNIWYPWVSGHQCKWAWRREDRWCLDSLFKWM